MIPSLSSSVSSLWPAVADHLWQSTWCAAAAALLVWTMRSAPARVRHAIWLAASVKFLVPFSLFVSLGAQARPASVPADLAPRTVTAAIGQFSQPFTRHAVGSPALAIDSGSGIPWFRGSEVPRFRGSGSGVQAREPRNPGTAEPRNPGAFLPMALALVWLAGMTALVAWRVRSWRWMIGVVRGGQPATEGAEVDAVSRVAASLGIGRVRVILSQTMSEPAIVGFFRPRLLWPAAVSGRLGAAEIDAILVHELQHVRRRDNLAAAVHMAVETIFWFHPLVWWIGARLVHERERACDEAVLACGAEPEQYAESLLTVCRLCLASPVRCVSGVSGSSLRRRVEAIMTAVPRRLTVARRLTLCAAFLGAVLFPTAAGFLHATPAASSPLVLQTLFAPATMLAPPASPSPATARPALVDTPHAGANAIAPAPATPRHLSGYSQPLEWNALPRQQTLPAPAKPGERTIVKGDRLHVESGIYKWDFTVNRDGAIAFPGLGAVKVDGLTSRQVEDFIERSLTDKGLLGSRDHIIVEALGAQTPAPAAPTRLTVYVSGEVRAPGEQRLAEGEMTLMRALTAAGGFTPMSGEDVYVLRPRRPAGAASAPRVVSPDDTTAERLRFSKKTLMKMFEQDPPVQPGDTIWVTQADMFFINGEVKSGGMKVFEPNMTVGDAIAMAGGLTDKASLRRSAIQRKNVKGTFDQIGDLKLDTPIQPRDNILIRRSLF